MDIPDLNQGSHRLEGTFKFNGVTYTSKIAMDQLNYGNGNGHKTFIIPEDYKLSTSPDFERVSGRRVECASLKGPGLKGIDGNDISRGVDCVFYPKYGSSESERVYFKLSSKSGSDPSAPLFRSIKPDGKTLKGQVVLYTDPSMTEVDSLYTVTLSLDVADYRNGNSHKAFIKAERAGQRINTSDLLGTGIKVTNCTHGMSSHQVEYLWKNSNCRM